jgi:hypothetical protein
MKKETLHDSSFKVFINHTQILHAMPVHSFKVRKLQHLGAWNKITTALGSMFCNFLLISLIS